MDKKYYAHTLEGKPPSEWQPLEEHLKNVAEMARSFAESFRVGCWVYNQNSNLELERRCFNEQVRNST
jgi:hypothetical protein